MKRRNFLKYSGVTTIGSSLALNGRNLNSFCTPSMLNLLCCDEVKDRVLVLINLGGGNDGINNFIPLNQYDAYRNYRPTLGISEDKYIKLDDSLPDEQQIGLHPAFLKFKEMYDNGMSSVIRGVGYHNQTKSHFKGQDLWMNGGDGREENFNIPNGWMGRFLDHMYSGTAGIPSLLNPDPAGIEIGTDSPTLLYNIDPLRNAALRLGKNGSEENFTIINNLGLRSPFQIPDTDYGNEIEYILSVQNNTSNYASRINDLFEKGSNEVDYPIFNLAGQLKTVAKLISGGSKTKVFMVRISGFDTHDAQVDNNDPAQGAHADLLQEVAESVHAFYQDLEAQGHSSKVVSCTFSEFGRKVFENGNRGTDHGTLGPMMIFGENIKGGVLGVNPNLDIQDDEGALGEEKQYDYRQVFTTLLQDWLGAPDDAIEAAYFGEYLGEKLDLLNTSAIANSDCYVDSFLDCLEIPQIESLEYNLYPNPFSQYFTIEYNAIEARKYDLEVFDFMYNKVHEEEVEMAIGNNILRFTHNYPQGQYILKMTQKNLPSRFGVTKIVKI